MTLNHGHIDLLMPAHNEAAGIEQSLGSCLQGLREVDSNYAIDMTVIANGCTDNTVEIAEAWGQQNVPVAGNLKFRVLERQEGHKNRALNAALRKGEGDITFAMDADVTLDPLALGGLCRILSCARPLGASLYHGANPDFLPDGILGDIIQMGDLRRQAIPTRLKLHGGFMGWNSQATVNGKPVEFPAEQPVSDDTWLSYALVAEHGTQAIHSTNSGIFSRYIPPQTTADYIRQNSRYAIADELVGQCFPELQPVIEAAQKTVLPASKVNPEWQRLCALHGIDFGARIEAYRSIRQEIARGKQSALEEILANNGQWKPISTARITPIKLY